MPQPSHKDQVIHYYRSIGSRLGYRFLLGGNKHFGYYPDKRNSVSMRRAMVNMQEQLGKKLGVKRGAKVLDAGCGMGDTALYISRKYQAEVTGVDLLDFNIKAANKKRKAADRTSFRVGDYARTGWPADSFDAIYTLETLVHAPDYQKALTEFYRLLKPGGRLVLFEYSHARYEAVDDHTADMFKLINTYSAMPSFEKFFHGVLEDALKKTGLRVVSVTDISDHMKPMERRFWQIAFLPYQLIRRLHLQRYFVNTTAGYELYAHFEAFRYNIFVADKPLRRQN